MKAIFDHIEKCSAKFKERPLFVYLRDDKMDPGLRLEFIPCIAHFVMTFADLYHFFLTENPPKDRYQELVNTHLSEEGTHWRWFLADLTKLGLDPTMRFTDACRFIWGDATIKTRTLAYEMCKLSAGMTSLQKLVMVHAIEATGRVGLESSVPTGAEIGERTGRTLVYFGNHHLETERQHTVEGDEIHASLESILLTDAERATLISIVDQVFHHFAGFVDEAFDFAQRGRPFGNIERREASPSALAS